MRYIPHPVYKSLLYIKAKSNSSIDVWQSRRTLNPTHWSPPRVLQLTTKSQSNLLQYLWHLHHHLSYLALVFITVFDNLNHMTINRNNEITWPSRKQFHVSDKMMFAISRHIPGLILWMWVSINGIRWSYHRIHNIYGAQTDS